MTTHLPLPFCYVLHVSKCNIFSLLVMLLKHSKYLSVYVWLRYGCLLKAQLKKPFFKHRCIQVCDIRFGEKISGASGWLGKKPWCKIWWTAAQLSRVSAKFWRGHMLSNVSAIKRNEVSIKESKIWKEHLALSADIIISCFYILCLRVEILNLY